MKLYCETVPCPLGYLLLAATERGIRAVTLGDSPAALQAALQKDFLEAQQLPGSAAPFAEAFNVWLGALQACLLGKPAPRDLPLDAQGTPFQERVWAELRQIPAGQTRSYTQVAEALGSPKSVRAVAHACASNPIALLIPCHRVLRADGALAGYRWGLARKQALLALEQA